MEIRGTGREERELTSYLHQHSNSPFNKVNLEAWLQRTREETSVLESFLQRLQNVVFCENTGEYFKEILKYDKVVSLNMYFPANHDPVLDQMDNLLEGHNSTRTGNAVLWVRDFPTMMDFQIAIEDFLNYRIVNTEDTTVGFLYSLRPFSDRNQHFPHIEIKGIYTEGRRRLEETFIPPGQPTAIRQTIINNTVLVQWEPPSHGAAFVQHYQIVLSQRGMRHFGESIEYRYQTVSNETEFQIATPDSSVPYDVHVYGVCRVGRTASSEVLTHSGAVVRLVGGAEICSPRQAHGGRVEVGKWNCFFFQFLQSNLMN